MLSDSQIVSRLMFGQSGSKTLKRLDTSELILKIYEFYSILIMLLIFNNRFKLILIFKIKQNAR